MQRGGTKASRMPVVAYAAGDERGGEEDIVQLVNEFEETTGKVEVTHQTVERDDTRPVPLSERFWDSWYWFWRKLIRVRCSCKKGCQQCCFRERYALAWGIVCFNVVSVILYCIAAATVNWSVVYAFPEFDESHVNPVTDNRFEHTTVTLGLFRTFNHSDAGYSIIRREAYNDIGKKGLDESLIALVLCKEQNLQISFCVLKKCNTLSSLHRVLPEPAPTVEVCPCVRPHPCCHPSQPPCSCGRRAQLLSVGDQSVEGPTGHVCHQLYCR